MSKDSGVKFQNSPFAYKLHNFVFQFDKIADDVLQKELDITLSQFVVLKILTHVKDCKQKSIANNLHMTEGAISRQIERLRERGLITRTTKENNRREHEINCTHEGENVRQKASAVLAKTMKFISSALSEIEMKQFENAIDKLHARVVEYNQS